MTTAATLPTPVPCEGCKRVVAGLTFDPITRRRLCAECWRRTSAVRDREPLKRER